MAAPGEQTPSAGERRREATRARLLDAALDLFAQRRIADVAVEDLLAAADVSRATFYGHFAGKAELVQELGAELAQLAASAVLAVNELPSWSRPRLRAYVEQRAEREWAAARRAAIAVGQAHVADGGAYRERLDALVERLIAGDPRWAAMGPERARLRARLFAIQLEGAFVQWAVWGWSERRERDVEIVAELFWTALRAGGEDDR